MRLIRFPISLPRIHILAQLLLLVGSLEASQSLIEKFKAATCLPLDTNSGILPRSTRAWNTTVTLRDSSKVTVRAAAIPGGSVGVTYLSSGKRFIAADAGDYVYPYDIRIDNQNDRLYIAARGLAGGLWWRTVLFEYDLRAHLQTAHGGVKFKNLPNACSAPAQSDR
jgi:hypothetical protein